MATGAALLLLTFLAASGTALALEAGAEQVLQGTPVDAKQQQVGPHDENYRYDDYFRYAPPAQGPPYGTDKGSGGGYANDDDGADESHYQYRYSAPPGPPGSAGAVGPTGPPGSFALAYGALCQPLSYIVEAEKQYDIDGTTYSYGDDYFCLPNTFEVDVWPSMANATTVLGGSCEVTCLEEADYGRVMLNTYRVVVGDGGTVACYASAVANGTEPATPTSCTLTAKTYCCQPPEGAPRETLGIRQVKLPANYRQLVDKAPEAKRFGQPRTSGRLPKSG